MRHLRKILLTIALLVSAVSTSAHAASQPVTFNLSWVNNGFDNPATVANEAQDGIIIMRSIGGAPAVELARTVGFANTYTDSFTDSGGVTYCYRIAAFNSGGVSQFGEQACATSPVIVVVTVTPSAPGGINLAVKVGTAVP